MKILILGGGQVGARVAENLVSEENDITIVDLDSKLLKQLQDRLDIQTICGNAAQPSVLAGAGAADTDMLLALTRNDETNLVACKLARELYNVPTRIARVRASDYVEFGAKNTLDLFGVDQPICPEQIVTENLYQLFQYPGALQVLDFAGGRVQLVAVTAMEGGLLLGRELRHVRQDLPDTDCRFCAIYRNNRLIIPKGDTILQSNDEVFFLAERAAVPQMLAELRNSSQPIRRVLIAGGGNIGHRLARQLENAGYEVKIIEILRERCEWLGDNLDHTLVLHGEATDEALLEAENIDEMDVFCALTNDDEDNVMSTLLAKRMGAKRVIALVNRASYVDLLEGHSIDIVISPHQSTIGSILAHLRRGDVEAVHALRGGRTEAMEVIVRGDRKTSRLVGLRIDEVEMPHGCYISAIVRHREVRMAHHDEVINSEDHLIIFVAHRRLVREVEQLIQVKMGFF
ncbi:Trk system potassium transporter TrkA [Craterilacuibacter sinensis]|uniref:Trk system potassium uptake protein TrkA n=1 Tax=Craterilacuibacter sinensis TaxID=2686017 RepID=A0A845BWW9_9NEIS|nr:Trk system potassium transporter TrkA [Craterilacuibacter sinensis]MXR37003.1 Trk system potassium transporter TrkA [Craterilacuibacter sinensis]